MIYKNVLVPYDKSSHATRALETALKLVSDDPEAKVTVLYVTESPEVEDVTFAAAARMAGVQQVDIEGEEQMETSYRDQQKKEITRRVENIIADSANDIHISIATGKAHHAILNYAYENGSDLIVMGCRGLNALKGMLGSVSYAVIRSAEAPVFIIK